MADMVEAGVNEGEVTDALIPQGHGVEAHLAQAQMTHDGSTHLLPNQPSHHLHPAVNHNSHSAAKELSDDDANMVGLSSNADDEEHHRQLAASSGVAHASIESSKSPLRTSTNGIFGHQHAAQNQNVGFAATLSQLFSFGLPFAGIFAVAAVLLWKRLGDMSSHQAVV